MINERENAQQKLLKLNEELNRNENLLKLMEKKYDEQHAKIKVIFFILILFLILFSIFIIH